MISKKLLFLPVVILSLFVLSSCHQVSKKCCGKKQAWLKKSKSYCDKKKSWLKKSKSCCPTKYSVAGQAHVKGVNNENIQGEVFFERANKGEVEIFAHFKGLVPNQKFGFHVHEFGNCENKALKAGGHFNPWNKKHGSPEDQEKHLGDLGNLHSDGKGQASYSAIIEGRVKKFLGRSVVVHALPDDFTSQPTGKSGDRIACGVIVASMPSLPVKHGSDKVQETGDSPQKAPTTKTVVPKNIKGSIQKASSVTTSTPKDAKTTEEAPTKPDTTKDAKTTEEAPAKPDTPKDAKDPKTPTEADTTKDKKKTTPTPKVDAPKETGNSPK